MSRIRSTARVPASFPHREAPPFLSSTNLNCGYFPGRGLLFSVFFHFIVYLALLYLPGPGFLEPEADSADQTIQPHPNEVSEILYIPLTSGNDQGMELPADRVETRPKESSAPPAFGTRGFTYRGPQRILSDLPDPTNYFQTILQPTLQPLPTVTPPVYLPNIVMLEKPAPMLTVEPQIPVVTPVEPEEPTPPTKEAKPEIPPEVKETVKSLPAVKLPLAAMKTEPPPDLSARVTQNAMLVETQPPEPPPKKEPPEPVKAAPPAKTPPETRSTAAAKQPVKRVEQTQAKEAPPTAAGLKAPVLQESSAPPPRIKDVIQLLSLSPMPLVRAPPFEVPAGEARGSFAISPDPSRGGTETKPGTEAGPPAGRVKERPTAAAAGKAVGGNADPVGSAANEAKAGAAKAAGSSKAGTGENTMRGIGVGAGSNTTSIKTVDPDKGAFAGITITGGISDPVAAGGSTERTIPPPPLQTAYDYIVISTENSGGGLPLTGVFSQEQIYTVFLDMRENELDPTPQWPMEFAVLPSAAQADASKAAAASQQGFILPFPTFKEKPALPAEIVRRYLGSMILVFAVVNLEGRMEKIAIKESPDASLNAPVVEALRRWVFRPAQYNGAPSRAQVLIGIPLWLPQH